MPNKNKHTEATKSKGKSASIVDIQQKRRVEEEFARARAVIEADAISKDLEIAIHQNRRYTAISTILAAHLLISMSPLKIFLLPCQLAELSESIGLSAILGENSLLAEWLPKIFLGFIGIEGIALTNRTIYKSSLSFYNYCGLFEPNKKSIPEDNFIIEARSTSQLVDEKLSNSQLKSQVKKVKSYYTMHFGILTFLASSLFLTATDYVSGNYHSFCTIFGFIVSLAISALYVIHASSTYEWPKHFNEALLNHVDSLQLHLLQFKQHSSTLGLEVTIHKVGRIFNANAYFYLTFNPTDALDKKLSKDTSFAWFFKKYYSEIGNIPVEIVEFNKAEIKVTLNNQNESLKEAQSNFFIALEQFSTFYLYLQGKIHLVSQDLRPFFQSLAFTCSPVSGKIYYGENNVSSFIEIALPAAADDRFKLLNKEFITVDKKNPTILLLSPLKLIPTNVKLYNTLITCISWFILEHSQITKKIIKEKELASSKARQIPEQNNHSIVDKNKDKVEQNIGKENITIHIELGPYHAAAKELPFHGVKDLATATGSSIVPKAQTPVISAPKEAHSPWFFSNDPRAQKLAEDKPHHISCIKNQLFLLDTHNVPKEFKKAFKQCFNNAREILPSSSQDREGIKEISKTSYGRMFELKKLGSSSRGAGYRMTNDPRNNGTAISETGQQYDYYILEQWGKHL